MAALLPPGMAGAGHKSESGGSVKPRKQSDATPVSSSSASGDGKGGKKWAKAVASLRKAVGGAHIDDSTANRLLALRSLVRGMES